MWYKVFLSSTSKDLREHREAVREALAKAGYVPIEMGRFMARPDTPLEVSLAEVGNADVFVGLYAWRYGFVPEGHDRSITEMELDEAVKLELECLLFLSDAEDPAFRAAADRPELQERLRRRIETRWAVAYFRQPQEAAVQVLASLSQWQKRKVAAAPAERDPAALALLEHIRTSWIEEYFARTLPDGEPIMLGKSLHLDRVDHPRSRTLRAGNGGDRILPPSEKLLDVLGKHRDELLILGEPGSGKTLTLLELARDAVDRAWRDAGQPLPVILQLSDWNGGPRLADWVVEELNRVYRIARRTARDWLESGGLLLLLDGLDEVAPERRAACVEAINAFRGEHTAAGLVVCSRTAELEELPARLEIGAVVELTPLRAEDVEAFLIDRGEDLAAVHELWREDAEWRELLRLPLWLNVASTALRGSAVDEAPEDVPPAARRERLLDAYVERMFHHRRDVDDASRNRIEGVLGWLADRLSDHGLRYFYLEEIQPSWLATRGERWAYVLGSRLVAALALGLAWREAGGLALGFLGGLGAGLVDAARFERAPGPRRWRSALYVVAMLAVMGGAWAVSRGGWEEPASGMAMAAVLALFFGLRGRRRSRRTDVRWVDTLAWSWRGMLLGTAPGLAVVLGFLALGSLGSWQVRGPFVALFVGVPLALLGGLVAGLRGKSFERRIGPGRRVLVSARFGLLAGGGALLAVAALRLAYGVWLHGWSDPAGDLRAAFDLVVIALPLGVVLALGLGGLDAIQHGLLRSILSARGRIPWRLAAVLDTAAELILLRTAGAGYLFLHAFLQEHFRRRYSGPGEARVASMKPMPSSQVSPPS